MCKERRLSGLYSATSGNQRAELRINITLDYAALRPNNTYARRGCPVVNSAAAAAAVLYLASSSLSESSMSLESSSPRHCKQYRS